MLPILINKVLTLLMSVRPKKKKGDGLQITSSLHILNRFHMNEETLSI